MFIRHLIFAVLTALLLSGVFFAGFRKRGSWNSLVLFFVVVTLVAWAGGIWLSPMGPQVWGVYWLGFLVAGLVAGLLLVAVMPPVPPDTTVVLVQSSEKEPEEKKRIVLGVYFWLLVISLVVLILSRYF